MNGIAYVQAFNPSTGSETSVGELPVSDLQRQQWNAHPPENIFFIAHRGEIKHNIAEPTAWFLNEVLGIPAFLDRNLEPDTRANEEIKKAATTCERALVILSPNFRHSEYCVRELNTFLSRWNRGDRGFKITVTKFGEVDIGAFGNQFENVTWLPSTGPERQDEALYMIETLWPHLVRVASEYTGRPTRGVSTTQQLESCLAQYVAQTEGTTNYDFPANLSNFRRNHYERRRGVGCKVACPTLPHRRTLAAVFCGLVVSALLVALVVSLPLYLPNNGKPVQEPETLEIVVATHDTKMKWMDGMEFAFNDAALEITDHQNRTRRLIVQVCHTGSRLDEDPCGDGRKPTIWSPPHPYWIDEYNEYVKAPDDCTFTTDIPLGIAMWREMADSLGWPDAKLGWDTILDLIVRGWDDVLGSNTHSFGSNFHYGHGHPFLSNSGTLYLSSSVRSFAGIGFDVALTESQIFDPEVENKTRELALAVQHMGEIDTALLWLMVKHGTTYLHGAVNYESNIERFNEILRNEGKQQLVLIYPKDGTYWMSHPLCTLDGPRAAWVTEDERKAAAEFTSFVTREENQQELCKYGIRPSNEMAQNKCLGKPPFTESYGTDPRVTKKLNIRPPDSNEIALIREMWKSNRKPVKWTLVLDYSSSMSENERIKQLREAAKAFVDEMVEDDYISIIVFNSQVDTWLPLQPLTSSHRLVVHGTINGLQLPRGLTRLRDATRHAINEAIPVLEADRRNNLRYNYGVLVFTDGDDTESRISAQDVYGTLPSEGNDPTGVHIFPVALGNDNLGKDDQQFLETIANITNGRYFKLSSNENLEDVFTRVQAEL